MSDMSQLNRNITDATARHEDSEDITTKTSMKQEGEKDCQEIPKRRRRNRRKEVTSSANCNNSVTRQEKLERNNAGSEQRGKRREHKTNSGKEQNRRYGMVVEDIYIDMEDVVYDIKEGKLSLEALPKLGLFPLHEAVARGLTKCAESLIELGLQLTCETPDGLTPLEVAVMAGNFDAAALLIQYGAPIDRIRDGIPRFM